MTTVITYGTFDMLHHGHVRLLERAKALGDYLIVGVTSDNFDRSRGKINVRLSLMERVEAVRQLNIADKIIIEEYEGQKIDDIKKYSVDIFTVGSDWDGKFDYLKEYCKVVYLQRTEGISSSEIRSETSRVRLGLVGNANLVQKHFNESRYVNGIIASAVCAEDEHAPITPCGDLLTFTNPNAFLEQIDAVYIASHPSSHYAWVKKALCSGKHVLCESPIALSREDLCELVALAKENGLVLMDAVKTAYSTAYDRLLLLLKSGAIGRIISVDVTCTSLRDSTQNMSGTAWNSVCSWGPTALMPVFHILGTQPNSTMIHSLFLNEEERMDLFTKFDFDFGSAVASAKVGKGVKSEGELVISGTQGYVYVPAPWWKTEYFEIRFEHAENNRRYFYGLEGEGIRNELLQFARSIESKKNMGNIDHSISAAIVSTIERFYRGEYTAL